MRPHLYLFLFGFLLLGRAFAQAPTVVSPANLSTGLSTLGFSVTVSSSSTGNTFGNPETINIEMSDAADFVSGAFYWSSNDFIRSDDIPANYSATCPALSPGTVYYIRGISDAWAEGASISITTASTTIVGTNRLNVVDGKTPNTSAQTLTVFPNKRKFSLDLNQAIVNATQYVIQFDTTSANFNNPVDSIIINSTSTSYRVDVGWLTGAKLSGSPVYVRSRGISPTSRGPWGNIRKFGAPLQPCSLKTPTGTINRNAFKLWSTTVGRATRLYWQVSKDNFATFYSMSGTLATKNETVTGVTGNCFRNNYSIGTADRAFDYLGQLTNNTTYQVRVRAWNNQQVGYWADTLTITPTPTLTASIKTPANSATNQPTGIQFSFNDDPNFNESSYDFQIATDAGFTSIVVDQPGIASRGYFTTALSYNATYFARVRANVASLGLTSSWSSITFTTKAAPTLSISYPTAGLTLPNRNVYAYSTWEAGVTQYQWEIQKTNLPADAGFSGNSSSYGNSFGSYLVGSGAYQIRVRGFVGSQSITGPFSAWVAFSIAPSGIPIPVVQPNSYIANARLAGGDAVLAPLAFPNPFNRELVLALPKEAVSYSVINVSGQVVDRNDQAQPAQALGADWQPGTYMVRILDATGKPSYLRVVKQ